MCRGWVTTGSVLLMYGVLLHSSDFKVSSVASKPLVECE